MVRSPGTPYLRATHRARMANWVLELSLISWKFGLSPGWSRTTARLFNGADAVSLDGRLRASAGVLRGEDEGITRPGEDVAPGDGTRPGSGPEVPVAVRPSGSETAAPVRGGGDRVSRRSRRLSRSVPRSRGHWYDQPPEPFWPATSRRANVRINSRSAGSPSRSRNRIDRARS